MPRHNKLNEVRRSQVLGYGPGAIVDFRVGDLGGGTISGVTAGFDQWGETARPKGMLHSQSIKEPRLQRKLGVNGFRLPPVNDTEDDEKKDQYIHAIRFPTFLICPSCKIIKKFFTWAKGKAGDPQRHCSECTRKKGNEDNKIYVVPARFIMACENGHLDDFPWRHWLGCKCDIDISLKLESIGSSIGLSGLVLRCTKCGLTKSMKGIFNKKTFKGLVCKGKMPWLKKNPNEKKEFFSETCDKVPVALQRGASNLYYPCFLSAISIPPWTSMIFKITGLNFDAFFSPHHNKQDIIDLLKQFRDGPEYDAEKDYEKLKKYSDYLADPAKIDLKWNEYLQFTEQFVDDGLDHSENDKEQFEIRNQNVEGYLANYLNKLVQVVRLREVRALANFKRISEPLNSFNPGKKSQFGKMFNEDPKWRPAIEVKGEGIFISLKEERLKKWENSPSIKKRASKINDHYMNQFGKLTDEGKIKISEEIPYNITPRFLLLHSLSHALISQLSIECGYAQASLRERMYVTEKEGQDMSGILIYTSSSDSEGTLGGLSRQALTKNFENVLKKALEQQEFCSQDPHCIMGIKSESEQLNHAACHSCMLLPETSCELWNRFLDRATIRGTLDGVIKSYFE